MEWLLDADENIRERAEDLIRELSTRDAPFHANIKSDIEASWYCLQSTVAHERILTAHLASRRFGVYLPMVEQKTKQRPGHAKAQKRWSLLLPGYVFLWVRDLAAHMRQVKACPGFGSFLCNAKGNPLIVPHKVIEEFLRTEAREAGFFHKRSRKEIARDPAFRVTIKPYSSFPRLDRVTSDTARISLFRIAMGLRGKVDI